MDDFVKWNDVSIFFHIPFDIWKQLECRMWKSFHESQEIIKYSDKQMENAMRNTLWYKRSNPNISSVNSKYSKENIRNAKQNPDVNWIISGSNNSNPVLLKCHIFKYDEK